MAQELLLTHTHTHAGYAACTQKHKHMCSLLTDIRVDAHFCCFILNEELDQQCATSAWK